MKRRNNGMWLPPSPFDSVAVAAPDTPVTNTTQCIIKRVVIDNPPTAGASRTVSVGLVGDYNENLIAGSPGGLTSGEFVGNTIADMAVGYSLKRVVGKLFVGVTQEALAASAPWDFMVTAGMIIRRVNESGDPTAINTFTDTYDAARDPWLWRRNYFVQNLLQRPAGAPLWPQNNMQVAGVLDGPHVDAKTRRTVKSEERLFLDITTTALNGTGQEENNGRIEVTFDLRFFGRVFTSAGNRRNATR